MTSGDGLHGWDATGRMWIAVGEQVTTPGATLRAEVTVSAREEPLLLRRLEVGFVQVHGSASAVWHAIARSATTHISEEAIHEAVGRVTRWPARVLIVSAMDAVAAANGISPEERPILAFIRELWSTRGEGPFR